MASEGPSLLRAAGLRVTAPRLAVLTAIPYGQHLDADTITRIVRGQLGRVSTQAVYDVLNVFTAAGLVRRIELPGQTAARYERRVGDNHHHLVCRACGDVIDVDCAVGQAPCLTPSVDGGYAIDEAEVVYWGLCPECRRAIQPPAHVPHTEEAKDD
ncbi:MAG: Fur family transcriptional regulator, stress-responsive regulator [Mycobacteriales bacterium]|jgi:Fe2+ or Zn2+ uptake regulation protein